MFCFTTGSIVRFTILLLSAISIAACDSVDNAALPPNEAPTASSVSITDDNGDKAEVGDSLTGTYIYSDKENDAEGASTYRWFRNKATIGGATTSSYTLVAVDIGKSITFEVTPVAISGTITGSAITSAPVAVPVPNLPPTASSVSITDTNGGSILVGDTLTGNYSYADIDGDTEGTSTFRWLRNGIAISGATNATYTLADLDSAASITFEVTPVALTGEITGSAVTSSAVAVLNFAPTASSVSIADVNGGNTVLGDSLKGNYTYTDADGDAEGSSTFRWLRNGTAITGATAKTYTVVIADIGKTITFEVTPRADFGTITGSTVTSSELTVINSAPTASSISITDNNGGNTVVGDTLTGGYTYADWEGDSQGTSTFRWLRNNNPISGATALTYIVAAADSGKNITFEVTPVATAGTTTGNALTSNSITVNNSAPTASSVSITDNNGGSIIVGDILTGNYTYVDIDGDAQGTSTFRWLRNGAAIGGATTSSYTLVAADSAASITFEVIPIAATGITSGSAVVSSGVTVTNSAPTASSVSVTDNNGGSVVVSDTLTGNYTYGDVDNDLEGTSTFRWKRNGTAITGATAKTYTVVVADIGQAITFEVTPVAATGSLTGSPVTSAPVSGSNSAPTASSVSITDNNGGSVVVGDTLTGNYTYTDIDGDVQGTSTFRWLRNGAVISGATAKSYTLVTADSGQSITFEVTPFAATGIASGSAVVSSGITVTNSAPTASSVSITDNNGGSVVVSDTLTGVYTYTDVDNDLEGVSTFRWKRNGTAITGATAKTYTVVVADIGQTITFEVTPVAATGTLSGTAVTSGPVSATNSAPTASSVNITDTNGGAAVVGDGLTGNYSYADIDGDVEGPTTFRWLRNGTAIAGASAKSYTLVTADSGQSITFEVTPIAATGTTTGTAVVSGGLIVANSTPTASGVNITDNNGGSVVVGDILTGNYTYADIDGDLEGISTFRWKRNGTAISGATAKTYTVVIADIGQTITFEVTPVAASGTTTGSAVTSGPVSGSNSAPTASAVSITDTNGGAAVVGDGLTGNYSYADIDGDVEGPTTFRWLRNGTAIAGASAKSYTLVTADSGQSITFEVTPFAATGIASGSAVVSSGITVTNSAPIASGVTITDNNGGSLILADTLTGNYSYSDVDGDVQGISTFRWLRNGAAISGATALSYTVVVADIGQTITFEVTPVAAAGINTGSAVVSGGLTVTNSAPTASAVSITDNNGGSTVVGDTLTGSYSYADWESDAQGSSTFRWLRNGSAISGAADLTYNVVAADSSASITFEVTPVALTGTPTGSAVVSGGITVNNSAPTASSVSITDTNGGSVVVGDTLSSSYTYADVDGDAQGTSTFRWLRSGAAISGATVSSYTLVAADSGQTITFEVTPFAAAGASPGSAVLSNGLAVVNSAPMASAVSISDNNGGSTVVGDTLTGNYTYADVDGDAQGTSTFRWLRNGTAIGSATAKTYVLVAADSGTSITFEVTPAAAAGTTTGSAVVSSGITVTNSAPTVSGVNIIDDNGGNAVVGDSLTGSYIYNDVDGDIEGTSTFRWLRNGTAIGSATAKTYVLVAADSGTSITFEVTPVAAAGTTTGSAVSSSPIAVLNFAPTAGSVSITDNNGGTTVLGDILTGNYTYNDTDGDAEGASTFRWLRNGTAITGATAKTYIVAVADIGQSLTFEVTPIALSGTLTGNAVTSSDISVINSAPTASSVIVTDNNGGSTVVGDILSGSYSYTDWEGDAQGSSTFRWLRNGTAISGATASTYTLAAADSGQAISFEVTPVALTGTPTGSAVVSSNSINVANSAPTASAVNITGNATIGATLTGNYSYADVDNDVEGSSTFRWLRNGSAISLATASTYTLVAADSEQAITFEVTPVALTGTPTGSAVVSSNSISVANSAPTASSVSIIDDNGGLAAVGDSLTGSYTYSDIDGDIEGTSTFRWLRDGTTTVGTALTYTLVAADSGSTITFEVTPVAAAGAPTGNAAVSAIGITVNTAPTASSVSIIDDNGGDAMVGDSLTGSYIYADIDSDSEGTSTFRWLRNGTTTVGTSSTYTLVALDSGSNITFEVTPVAVAGTITGTAVTSADLSVANTAPVASAVSITDNNGGSAVVGDTLIGSYTYSDIDGDSEGISTFRWLRDGSTTVGTAMTYTLVAADSGTDITFEVTPVALTGTETGAAVVSATAITVINSAPVANAGPDQTPLVDETVILDGSGSTDVDGDGLTFAWSFTSVPVGSAISTASLDLTDPVHPTFVVDAAGTYVVELIVNDGTINSAPSAVSISTDNSAPVADAGPDQTAPLVGATVTLDGSGSTDVDGNSLTYAWSFTSVPADSAITTASLDLTDPVRPTFVVDAAGSYLVQLIVNDGSANSTPSTVTISTGNSAPVADAGPDQTTPLVGATVTLDGSGSTDVDGNSLTYAWSFTSVPGDSAVTTATLDLTDPVRPTFVIDAAGTYVLQLIVNDGSANSTPSTVTISTGNTPPVANAGPDQTTPLVGATVILDGSASSDVDNDILTYSWSFTSVPVGSNVTTAMLDLADPVHPTFVTDVSGTYVVQLIVNDSKTNSIPVTVNITTAD